MSLPKNIFLVLAACFFAAFHWSCGGSSPSSPSNNGGNNGGNNNGGGLATSVPCPLTAPSYMGQIGASGSDPTVGGGFIHLWYGGDIAVDRAHGYLYVADYGHQGVSSCDADRVQQFNLSGGFVRQFYPSGTYSGGLDDASCGGMATDSAGNIYYAYNPTTGPVTCGTRLAKAEILKFNSSGVSIGVLTDASSSLGAMGFIHCMTLDAQDDLYVVADGSSGTQIRKLSTGGTEIATQTSNGYLYYANSLSTDSNNNLYVLNGQGDQVVVYSSALAPVTSWGSYGATNGQFYAPMGLAVGPGNLVYVADNVSGSFGRIEVFKTDGTFCNEFDQSVNNFADDIKVDGSGNIYTEDSNFIRKYAPGTPGGPTATLTATSTPLATATSTPSATITPTPNLSATPTLTPSASPTRTATSTGTGTATATSSTTPTSTLTATPTATPLNAYIRQALASGFSYPWGVAVDGTGAVFVSDANTGRLDKFPSLSATPVATVLAGGEVDSIALDGSGNLFTAQRAAGQMVKYDNALGSSTVFATDSTGSSAFNGLTGVSVDGSGNVYSFEIGTSPGRVTKFNASATPVATFTQPATALAGYGIAANNAGTTVYVADTNNHRIVCYNGAGDTVLGIWGGTLGSGNGQFNSPYGVAVDPVSGDVYVADSNNNRIQRFTYNGTYVRQITTDGTTALQFPLGVAVDATGNLYVVDNQHNRIVEFGP